MILYLKKISEEYKEFGEEFSIVCGGAGIEEISEEFKMNAPLKVIENVLQ